MEPNFARGREPTCTASRTATAWAMALAQCSIPRIDTCPVFLHRNVAEQIRSLTPLYLNGVYNEWDMYTVRAGM